MRKGSRPDPQVWTRERRLLGNIIPALFVMPFALVGLIWLWKDAQDKGDFLGYGLLVFAASIPVCWLTLNWNGSGENK